MEEYPRISKMSSIIEEPITERIVLKKGQKPVFNPQKAGKETLLNILLKKT
ncbi:hypothetical protein [Pedobacter gandavensis]|uniref:hypothetical protein n=1 Tax=Pedobacter gandavensis TaxID=2679963 RepID=UPI00292F08FF|nr:hypothetical protein [Pedobacter gandavensis]